MSEPANNRIIYFFPDDTDLDSFTVLSPHVPNVGDRISISSLELRPTDVNRQYGDHRYWRVKERTFCCTVATSSENIVRVGNQQYVEIILERIP